MPSTHTPIPPFRVKTTHSWPGEVSGDLGFVEGDIVEVLSIVDQEWWMGKLLRNQLQGIFPAAFSTVLEDRLSQNRQLESRLSTAPPPTTDKPTRQTDRLLQSQSSRAGEEEEEEVDEELVDLYGFSFRSSKNKFDYQRLSNEEYLQLQNLQLQQQQVQLQQQLLRQQRMSQSLSAQNLLRARRGGMASSRSENTLAKRTPSPPKGFASYDGYYTDPLESQGKSQRGKSRTDSHEAPRQRTRQLEAKPSSASSHRHSQPLTQPESDPSKPSLLAQWDRKSLSKSHPEAYRKSHSLGDRSQVSRSRNSRHSESSNPPSLTLDLSFSSASQPSEESLPPLPPKHAVPRFKSNPNINGILERPRGNLIPYDADDLKLSLLKAKMESDEVYDEALLQVVKNSEAEKLRTQGSETASRLGDSTQSQESAISIRSDFSATSAGSFAQHKFQNLIQELKHTLPENATSGELLELQKQIIDSMFELDKKSRHPNFLKKIFAKEKGAQAPSLPLDQRMMQLKLTEETFSAELTRMKTLRARDKQDRSRRANEEENVILKPFDFINDINKNEVDESRMEEPPYLFWNSKHDPQNTFSLSERFLKGRERLDLRDFLQEVDRFFHGHVLEKIKAVLWKLVVEFRIIPEASERISTVRPSQPLATLFAARCGTLYELNYLFKKMLDGIRVESEVVLGFMKKPERLNDTLIINHCWVSVLVNGEYRMIDLYLFQTYSLMNLTSYNRFYFMTKPLDLIHTHIPSMIDSQHIVPPVDLLISLTLPYCYSGYHRYALELMNFNNGLTKLKDHEFFEIDIRVPPLVEVYVHVKTREGAEHTDVSLCQLLWKRGHRVARIKALLPEKQSEGFLQVFAGPKGTQKTLTNVHELAVVIPLHHKGTYKPIDFVARFPTNQSKANDLYIKQPQLNRILSHQTYTFLVSQHPSGPAGEGVPCKLGLQTPSGKLLPLQKEDNGKPYGIHELSLRVNEIGTYRGLVTADDGSCWCVFAAWECVASSTAGG